MSSRMKDTLLQMADRPNRNGFMYPRVAMEKAFAKMDPCKLADIEERLKHDRLLELYGTADRHISLASCLTGFVWEDTDMGKLHQEEANYFTLMTNAKKCFDAEVALEFAPYWMDDEMGLLSQFKDTQFARYLEYSNVPTYPAINYLPRKKFLVNLLDIVYTAHKVNYTC